MVKAAGSKPAQQGLSTIAASPTCPAVDFTLREAEFLVLQYTTVVAVMQQTTEVAVMQQHK